jgi:hypothetical protein
MNKEKDDNRSEAFTTWFFYRSNGECVCQICGKLYREHELDKEILDWDGTPFLNILCNGERVKL